MGEDYGEGEKQNVISFGERRPISQRQGQHERCRERNDTAHARPGDNSDLLPRGNWAPPAQFFAEQTRLIRGQ